MKSVCHYSLTLFDILNVLPMNGIKQKRGMRRGSERMRRDRKNASGRGCEREGKRVEDKVRER